MLYDHLSVSPEGHLLIDGADTVLLAREYGTPLYVLSEDRVRKNCRTYTDAFRAYFPEGSAVLERLRRLLGDMVVSRDAKEYLANF